MIWRQYVPGADAAFRGRQKKITRLHSLVVYLMNVIILILIITYPDHFKTSACGS